MNNTEHKNKSLLGLDAPCINFHSPGVTRAFLLYLELDVYAPLKIGHDGGTEKHCIAIFTNIHDLDEFTGRVFGIPFTSIGGWESSYVSCFAYSVESIPLFKGIETIQKFAEFMRDDILHLLPPTRRPKERAEIERKISDALSSK